MKVIFDQFFIGGREKESDASRGSAARSSLGRGEREGRGRERKENNSVSGVDPRAEKGSGAEAIASVSLQLPC